MMVGLALQGEDWMSWLVLITYTVPSVGQGWCGSAIPTITSGQGSRQQWVT